MRALLFLSIAVLLGHAANAVDLTLDVAVTNASCGQANGLVDLSVIGGEAPYQYNWNNGAVTEDLADVPAGNYLVTVVDASGNSAVAAAEVASTPSVQTFLTPTASCGPANGSIDVVVTGGTPPFEFSWSPSLTSTTDLDSGTYFLTVTDAAGCTAFDSTHVGYNKVPEACVQPLGDACGCSLPFTVSFANCAQPDSGTINEWFLFGGVASTAPDEAVQTVTYAEPGTYPVWLYVTAANGCTALAGSDQAVQISANTLQIVGPDTVLINNTASFQAFNVISYDWSVAPTNGALPSNATSNPYGIFFTQAGLYHVCLDAPPPNGCGSCTLHACKDVVVIDTVTATGLLIPTTLALALFPNPSNGLVVMEADARLSMAVRLRLFDQLGRVVFESPIPAGSKTVALDLYELPRGLYMYEFEASNMQAIARGKLTLR